MTEEQPTYILDTSVAVKWLLRSDEPYLEQSDAVVRDYQANRIDLLAPIHLTYEIGQALVRAVRRDRITEEDAQDQLQTFLALEIALVTQRSIVTGAISDALRFGCSLVEHKVSRKRVVV